MSAYGRMEWEVFHLCEASDMRYGGYGIKPSLSEDNYASLQKENEALLQMERARIAPRWLSREAIACYCLSPDARQEAEVLSWDLAFIRVGAMFGTEPSELLLSSDNADILGVTQCTT